MPKEVLTEKTQIKNLSMDELVNFHAIQRFTLDRPDAFLGQRINAWLNLAEFSEIIRKRPDIETIKKEHPEIVYSNAKTIAFYRHVLELDPTNEKARKAYEDLAKNTFEETVLSRLYGEEYEPAAYLPVSPRLIEPLKGPLIESEEVESYWSQQSDGDKEFIQAMDNQIEKPMDPNCRITIGIPSYMEEGNIYRTLEVFTKQRNIDPSEFEVIVFENHPASKGRDGTKQEIERFQRTYPHLKVHHVYFAFPHIVPMGTIRKIGADLGLKRRMESQKTDPSKEFIIATNDADSYGMKPKSLRFIIDTIDNRPEIASITGKLDYPKEALAHFPTLHALIRFNAIYSLMNDTNAKNSGYSSGASSYMRASIYTATGGFDYKAKRGEDAERARRMFYYGQGQAPFQILTTNAARYYTDPRRAIDTMSKGKPWREQWQDVNWQENNGHVLGTSWKDFADSTLTAFNKKRFEEEINSPQHRGTMGLLKNNPNSEEAKRRLNALRRTMDFMGIKYKIDLKAERIVLTDTNSLEDRLRLFKTELFKNQSKDTSTTTEAISDVCYLGRGKGITLEYDPKKPIILILPNRRMLRIVGITELESLKILQFPKDHFVIVDLKLFKATKGKKGYKGLGVKDKIVLGRTQRPLRFDFGPEISDQHVKITRNGKTITIKDLSSENGAVVLV